MNRFMSSVVLCWLQLYHVCVLSKPQQFPSQKLGDKPLLINHDSAESMEEMFQKNIAGNKDGIRDLEVQSWCQNYPPSTYEVVDICSTNPGSNSGVIQGQPGTLYTFWGEGWWNFTTCGMTQDDTMFAIYHAATELCQDTWDDSCDYQTTLDFEIMPGDRDCYLFHASYYSFNYDPTPQTYSFEWSGNCVGVPEFDDDNDGVNNCRDVCASTPSGESVGPTGCSDAEADSDNDGVCDPNMIGFECTGSDECPGSIPSDGPVGPTGCNDKQVDDDLDGVCNPGATGFRCWGYDLCPGTDADATVTTSDGCSSDQMVPPLDILFLMDESYSMNPSQEAIRNNIPLMFQDLSSRTSNNFRAGIVGFGANVSYGEPVMLQSLTNNETEFRMAAEDLRAWGGWEPALKAFTQAAKDELVFGGKLSPTGDFPTPRGFCAVLVSDEPPHYFSQYMYEAKNIIDETNSIMFYIGTNQPEYAYVAEFEYDLAMLTSSPESATSIVDDIIENCIVNVYEEVETRSPTRSLLPSYNPTHSAIPSEKPTFSASPSRSPTHSPKPSQQPSSVPSSVTSQKPSASPSISEFDPANLVDEAVETVPSTPGPICEGKGRERIKLGDYI